MNWLTVEEGVAEPVALAVPVTVEAWLEAAECALETALLTEDDKLLAADEAAEEAADEAEEAADEAAEVAEATADEAAEELSGISMGAPAALQVSSTAAIVVAWSAALHAL